MDIDRAVILTQDRLAEEGGTMADLLRHFRSRISPLLIGESEWERVLDRAGMLPITMGALPFGFELPLHERTPRADFGVSLASGTRSGDFFADLARNDKNDQTAKAVARLFEDMNTAESALHDIVGRKLMLEYDIGSASADEPSVPGMFLRPGERPINGGCGQMSDVATVVEALISCLGWEMSASKRRILERVYRAQPEDTRMDSIGVFPARSQAVRLAIMGFKSEREVCSYLAEVGWPGEVSAVDSVIGRFKRRANIVRNGINIDIEDNGIGPTLGLTLIVKQRYTNDSRYWLDGLTDWDPFLDALRYEEIVVPEKLKELADWVSKPTTLFAKSGRYVLLRGIHHIKLVVSGNQLQKAKAYVFLVLSAAVSS